MNQSSRHCTSEELHLMVDGRLENPERLHLGKHLDECRQCRRTLEALVAVDHSLRQLPPQTTRADFTLRVLDRLQHKPRTPWTFLLLENAASLFGLFVVLGIMVSVFIWTGVLDTTQASQSSGIADDMIRDGWESVAALIRPSMMWLTSRLPFVQGNGAASVLISVTIVVAVIAGVDRLVGRRFMQRT